MQGIRKRAVLILKAVLTEGRALKPLLESAYKETDDRDRRFLKELVSGVFRKRLYLEWILRGYLKKPSRIKPLTWFNLLTALYQIEFLDTPGYAVVNEAVEVEKSLGRNISLVNGLLRNYLRRGSKPPLPEEETKRLSILESHPEWLIKRWMKRFGPERTRALLRANNQEPPLILRVNSLKTTREEMRRTLKAEGVDCEYTKYSPLGLKVEHYSSFNPLSRHVGSIYIQDEAAQLVSYLLSAEPGMRILDACAAPGGKTLHIAELTGDRAEIIAVDQNPLSVKLMEENIRAGNYQSIRLIQSDILKFRPERPFHRIVVDAPCSSLGVIRRNPDVRYRHNEHNLKDFQKRQLEILLYVSEFLISGGVLLYSVCSFEPEETTEVVKLFLNKKRDSFIIDRQPVSVIPDEMLSGEGFFSTVDFINEMDGFFAVRFKRL